MRLLAGLGIIGVLLLFVWERVDIVRVGYRIEQLKTKKIALQREQDELRVKASALTAPDRIARAASEKLGMIPPQPAHVVLVRAADPPPAAGAGSADVHVARNDRFWRNP
jgi:cell division protein FtsL